MTFPGVKWAQGKWPAGAALTGPWARERLLVPSAKQPQQVSRCPCRPPNFGFLSYFKNLSTKHFKSEPIGGF